MNQLTSPENMASMRTEPIRPVQRVKFTHWSSPREIINCRFYFTPESPASIAALELKPVPNAPEYPTAPAGQTLAEEAIARYSQELDEYNVETAAREAILARFLDSEDLAPPTIPKAFPFPGLIFTHGFKSDLDNQGLEGFALGFARHHTVLLFEDRSKDLDHRAATFRSLLNHFTATAMGGRSKAARASTRAAIYTSCKILVFYTYPLIRGLETRYEELLTLDAATDVLFVLGDSDPLCPEIQLASIRKKMKARTWWVRVVNADHSFEFKGELKKRISDICGQIAGLWLTLRDPGLTELTIWEQDGVVSWTDWMAPKPDPEIPITTVSLDISNSHLLQGGQTVTLRLL
ncbi:hypothetical protein DL95DRAFT_463524 [Leptodontidium sp. 2 PMI_412]|nr:hypothetical protein DL95DRAFT_463524 [Leptodontidium sp. 2 PMI_412]